MSYEYRLRTPCLLLLDGHIEYSYWTPWYDRRHVPAVQDIESTLWLEWFDNGDGYWDADAAEYRRS